MLWLIVLMSLQLNDIERNAIVSYLPDINANVEDLGFDKKWVEGKGFRLSRVEQCMDQPLSLLDYPDTVVKVYETRKPLEIVRFALRELGVGIKPYQIEYTESCKLADSLPRWLTDFINFYKSWQLTYRSAIQFDSSFISKVLYYGCAFWCDEDDTLDDTLETYLNDELGYPYDTLWKEAVDTLLEVAKSFNKEKVFSLFYTLMMGLDEFVNSIPDTIPELKSFTIGDDIFIGGTGDDHITGGYSVIIDLGGNDIYENVARGVMDASIVIDLAGNDLYVGDKPYSLAAGILGIGIIYDKEGDDTYRACPYSLGAGFFGMGMVYDAAGDDIYEGGFFTQGAGNFGLGLLMELNGNDIYRAYDWTQGLGATWGYGGLIDYGGNDLYYAGAHYIHHPLLPRNYRSFAQGFAIGIRPDAGGGIGVLVDFAGNDFYNAEVYAQGTSYWYSLGLLLDLSGDDHYNAIEYAQGAGIHLSVGLLWDREGDDHYFSRYGPSQGEGHDLSVGMLIDQGGDDYYVVSGGQGVGLTNSVGVLLDSWGDDTYITREKNIGQGSAPPARGFTGIGMFLDLQGEDTYGKISVAEDNSIWLQGCTGVGVDCSLMVRPKEPIIEVERSQLEALPIDELFKEASEWGVGEARDKVKLAREVLAERGIEAIKYIWENEMDTRSGLALRAIREVAKRYPDEFKPYLYKGLHDAKRRVRANSIWLLGEIKDTEAVDSILTYLRDTGDPPRWALSALGKIGVSKAIPEIVKYIDVDDFSTKVTAVAALTNIKDTTCVRYLIQEVEDTSLLIRVAAERGLVKQAILEPIIQRMDEPIARYAVIHLINALASIGKDADIEDKLKIKEVLLRYLDAEDPILRYTAAKAIIEVSPPGADEIVADIKARETDLKVLKLLQRIWDMKQ